MSRDCYVYPNTGVLAGTDSVYFSGAAINTASGARYGEFIELFNSSSYYGGGYGAWLTTRLGGLGALTGSYYFLTGGRYRVAFLYNAQQVFETYTNAFFNIFAGDYNHLIGSRGLVAEVSSGSIYGYVDVDVAVGYIFSFGVRSPSGIPPIFTYSRIDITAI